MKPRYSDNTFYMIDGDILIGQIEEYDILLDRSGKVLLFWGDRSDQMTDPLNRGEHNIPPHILEYAQALGNLAS